MIKYISFAFLYDDAKHFDSVEKFKNDCKTTWDVSTTMYGKRGQEAKTIYELLGDACDDILEKIYACATVKNTLEFTDVIESISAMHHNALLQTSEEEYDIYIQGKRLRSFIAYLAIVHSLVRN